MDPDVIRAIIASGTGSRLFLLPLFIVTLASFSHHVSPPTELAWMAHPALLATSAVLLLAEFALDRAISPKSRKLFRTWTLVQSILSIPIVVMIVLTMSTDLSLPEVCLAISGGLTRSSLGRLGISNNLRRIRAWLGLKQGGISGFVFLVGVQFGWVVLAWKKPSIALALMGGIAFAALVMMSVAWVFLLFAQQRARRECTQCRHKHLLTARICPRCKALTLVVSTTNVTVPTQEAMLATAIATSWCDGRIDQAEAEYLQTLIERCLISPDRKPWFLAQIERGISVDNLEFSMVPHAEKERVLEVAATMMVADRFIATSEQAFYGTLARRLGVSDRAATMILRRYRTMAVS